VKPSDRKKIWRWRSGVTPSLQEDELAGEEPLEIRVNGRPVSVTMRTPGEDDELALGFLLTESLICDGLAVSGIDRHPGGGTCNVINVRLRPDVSVNFEQLTRHVFASSSCGLCGKATIEAVHRNFPPLQGADARVDARTLLRLPRALRRAQAAFNRTGGLHASAIFDYRGDLVVAREDVGRHNAVDKALGFGLLQGLLPFDRHILLVSGRSSFEIIQKALAGRIPVVAAVSAPSSLAVDFAQKSGQTLVGFLRGRRMNVYSMPKRIAF
jgi:FdhD protein